MTAVADSRLTNQKARVSYPAGLDPLELVSQGRGCRHAGGPG